MTAALDDPVAIRSADRELLSLALIDSRNRLLHLLAQDESPAMLKRAVRAGWYAEYWVSRHLQRQRGEACDESGPRLAGIEPAVDEWLSPGSAPPAEAVRAYLVEALEVNLDLLSSSAETDDALYFFRMSLLHEDRLCETLQQRLGIGAPPARGQRAPIVLPGQRWRLGTELGTPGLVPAPERWAHDVVVPEFEIDAQAVNWSQFVEFADDGGYDRAELWSAEGWAWAQAEGRRAPRHVEQLRGGVLVQRRLAVALGAGSGKGDKNESGPALALTRAAAGQAAMHISRHEAQAWCTWAGRRLPTAPEWELAAHKATSRGFVWGDVLEWVAGSARAYPEAGPTPAASVDTAPATDGSEGTLRGASIATPKRWHHPAARRFAPPAHDRWFVGFRSCAL
jgi:gamma-glutamyl hercynylcysteine S-oxide synthase